MELRRTNIEKLKNEEFDVLVVGGGINGAVSAAALASRGARVALVDRNDFAGETSQNSSNLAWGGIKYMESMEFPLVRKLCKSRNHLMRNYPSAVQEIRFLATLDRNFRWPAWFIWLGTWLYWLMGMGFTSIPKFFRKNKIKEREPVIDTTNAAGGVEYSDAYLHDNDSRFVFNFLRQALDMGCIAANYVECETSTWDAGNAEWVSRLRDTVTNKSFAVRSTVIVNAAGAYVDQQNQQAQISTQHAHLFSKGIHLIVDRVTEHKRVLAFFADDGRLFFAIPMGPRTCIGTTDTRVTTPETEVTAEDREFVLDNINKRLDLKEPLELKDVIAERCGVRPLVVSGQKKVGSGEDWLQLSRKHVVEINEQQKHISIFGGKLTDCLNVGEEVARGCVKLGVSLPYHDRKWYGEPPKAVKEEYFHQARLMQLDSYTAKESSEPLSERLWRRYGGHALGLLDRIRRDEREAEVLIQGTEYIRCEVEKAREREMVTKLDDFLRRRSKIAQIARDNEIRNSKGLLEACEILFGREAKQKYNEYFKIKSTGAKKSKSSSAKSSSASSKSNATREKKSASNQKKAAQGGKSQKSSASRRRTGS